MVLPQVKQLAALGPKITLVTFDKPADLAQSDDVQHVRESLADAGVRWVPLRYHKRPKVPATALDFAHGVARGLIERVRDRPDIVHCTNTFPLISPAVYYAARSAGVPVVQSLRNYRVLCLNATLLRDGKVCEDCLGRSLPWPGVMHGCYRQDRARMVAVVRPPVGQLSGL